MQCYDILFRDDKIGEVFVSSEGLYKRIRCICKLPDKSIWRLIALSEGKKIDIGVCIPGEKFAIDKRVSGKQVDNESLRFVIENDKKESDCQCVSVEEDKPFPYIKQLVYASYLKMQDKTQICINPVSKTGNHLR